MVFGITGNTGKDNLWMPVARIVQRLHDADKLFVLNAAVAAGLLERGLVLPEIVERFAREDATAVCDIVFSFGGDGTLLNTAHEVGEREIPILGVNIGRLGFLANVEVSELDQAIHLLEAGEFEIESRMVLEASADSMDLEDRWALNEFVIRRIGDSSLITIQVAVDGVALNEYWADGLIFASPTGSTAYSLAAGGPIVVPGSGAVVLTPISPHTLTVRPVILPDRSVITARVVDGPAPYVFTVDGRNTVIDDPDATLTIRKAPYAVRLVKLADHDYFQTLRAKLMWGARKS